jgi:hypothetical protein
VVADTVRFRLDALVEQRAPEPAPVGSSACAKAMADS